eukprot:scaffold71042_cov32-Tisochrysis_lutea.AAC.7
MRLVGALLLLLYAVGSDTLAVSPIGRGHAAARRIASRPVRVALPRMTAQDPPELAKKNGAEQPTAVGNQESPAQETKRDLFIPILVGVSFGGYACIILYDVFFGNGLCGLTVTCSQSPW